MKLYQEFCPKVWSKKGYEIFINNKTLILAQKESCLYKEMYEQESIRQEKAFSYIINCKNNLVFVIFSFFLKVQFKI